MEQPFNKLPSLEIDQYQTLLNAIHLINSTLDLDELLQIIVRELNRILAADRSTLFIVDETHREIWSKVLLGDEKLEIRLPFGKGLAGHVAQTGEVLNIPDAYQDPRFNPDVDRQSGYRTRSVLCAPVRKKDGKIIGVIQCINKQGGAFTAADVDFLLAFADYIALAIQNAQLFQAELERQRLENEMTVAGEIQRDLLPRGPIHIPGYQIFAFQEPARQVGGDYYDLFETPYGLSFVLADVSGKGIPAALLMSNLHAMFHALVEEEGFSGSRLIQKINNHLYAFTAADKFATLFWGTIDLENHTLRYVNAGHVPPALIHSSQSSTTWRELTSGGLPVGILKGVEYQEEHVPIAPGDLLFLCSDGVTEATNHRGDMLGLEFIKNFVDSAKGLNADEFAQVLIRFLRNFVKHTGFQDDVTILVIKRVE